MKHHLRRVLAAVCAYLISAAPAAAGPINGYPTAATPLSGAETVIGTQAGATVQITTQSIANKAPAISNFGPPGTGSGSIILTPGPSPVTTPVNGSLWVTTTGVFAVVNGSIVSLGTSIPSTGAGGSTGQIQFNSSSVLAGVPGFTWSGSVLSLPSGTTFPAGTILTSPALGTNTGLMAGTNTVIASPSCTGATWIIGTDIGSWCSRVTGTDNLSDGTITLSSLTSGFGNLAFGSEVMKNATTASNNACFGFESCHAITTGSSNDAVGFDALAVEQTGALNTAMGQNALGGQNGGVSNAGFGSGAGATITTGDNNTVIGASAGATVTTGSNNIALGDNNLTGITTGSNNVWIGGHGPTLVNQTGSITIADGNGTILEQYQSANGFDQFSQPLELPSFASSQGLSGAGYTLGGSAQVGTGASVACATLHVCDSISGEVTLTTGTGSPSAGMALTIGFNLTRANKPNCQVTSFGASAVAVNSNWAETTNSLAISSSAGLAPSTAYTVRYFCGGV